MDLSKLKELQNNAQKEIDENNEIGNNNNSGYKLLYPHENGSFRIKLIFNEKSSLLQRKIVRHKIDKLPCLSMYGQDCPICQEIRNAEESAGKDCGAFQKYGYQVRGISYGVLLSHDKGMFEKQNDPKDGEVVLFMYPISLYNQINEEIVKSGDFIESLVGSNNGKVFEITRSQKGNGPIDYSAHVYAYGDMKVRETEEEFEELLQEIPSLAEAIVPANLTEENLQKTRAAAETISAEYISGKVMNPKDESTAETPKREENNGQSLAGAMNPPEDSSSSSSDDGKPDCFGNHSDDNKCLACPYECDCLIA